jgi:hypothetical protein
MCTLHPERLSVATSVAREGEDEEMCAQCAAAWGLRAGGEYLTWRQQEVIATQRAETEGQVARERGERRKV